MFFWNMRWAADRQTPPTVCLYGMWCVCVWLPSISWAGLMYVVASEVLPQEVRSLGMGCVITTFWVFAFIIQSTLESMFTLLTRSGQSGSP